MFTSFLIAHVKNLKKPKIIVEKFYFSQMLQNIRKNQKNQKNETLKNIKKLKREKIRIKEMYHRKNSSS